MSWPKERRCSSCNEPLPEGAIKTRKYCDDKCRKRALRASRRGQTNTENAASVRWHYESLQKQQSRRERELDRVKIAHTHTQRELEKVKRQLANREAYISTQAERVAEARREAAELLIQRDQARQQAAEAQIDPAEYAQTQQFLQEGRAAYKTLRQQYDSMALALDGAVRERESLKEIVRSWDSLCRRLHRETKGVPRSAKDRETLELWEQFRDQMQRSSTAGSEEQ